jgi:hypothetical protein
MNYSITIIDPKVTGSFVKVFSSKEEKEKYVIEESKFCYNQLKAYWASATKEERAKASSALYVARMNFMKVYDHVPEEKERA